MRNKSSLKSFLVFVPGNLSKHAPSVMIGQPTDTMTNPANETQIKTRYSAGYRVQHLALHLLLLTVGDGVGRHVTPVPGRQPEEGWGRRIED